MALAQYLVIKRGRAWWITLDGARTGPFEDRSSAIDAAVTAARIYERAGHDAEVAVQVPEEPITTVYRTGEPS